MTFGSIVKTKVEKTFEENIKKVHKMNKKPTDSELLELYGLFKQAKFGDNETTKPYFYNLKACKKWDAWNENKGLLNVTAMIKYNSLCDRMYKRYN